MQPDLHVIAKLSTPLVLRKRNLEHWLTCNFAWDSGAVPLMAVRSYSSDTDSLGNAPGTQLPPPTHQEQTLLPQVPGPTPRDLGVLMFQDSDGSTLNPLFATCPDEIQPADDSPIHPANLGRRMPPIDTVPQPLAPSAAVPSPAFSEEPLDSVDPYRAFLDGGSDISGEGDAPGPDQDVLMHDINPAGQGAAENTASGAQSDMGRLRASGALPSGEPNEATSLTGTDLASSMETGTPYSALRDSDGSSAGLPVLTAVGALGAAYLAGGAASSAVHGADVAGPAASATPRPLPLPSRKRRQMGDLTASLSELRRSSQAGASISGVVFKGAGEVKFCRAE
jgi:hypothetical protein